MGVYYWVQKSIELLIEECLGYLVRIQNQLGLLRSSDITGPIDEVGEHVKEFELGATKDSASPLKSKYQ